MKRVILLTITLLISYLSSGQLKAKLPKEAGLTTTVSIIDYTFRGSLNPYFSLYKGKHSWSAGPLLLVATNVGSNISGGPKLTGFKASYRYFPNTESKRFQLYLSNELLVQRIKDDWLANAFDSNVGNFVKFNYRNVEFLVENYVGYGLRLNFGEQWYISKGVGVGFYVSNLDGDELDSEAPEVDNFDYRGYDDFGFSWNVQLGFGLKF